MSDKTSDLRKLRQTTLPWAPKPRPTDDTKSPHFTTTRTPYDRSPRSGESSTRSRGRGTRGQDSQRCGGRGGQGGGGRGRGDTKPTPSDESTPHRGRRRGRIRINAPGRTLGDRDRTLSHGESTLSRESSISSLYIPAATPDVEPPKQHIFPIPTWCRKIRKVNMTSPLVPHKLLLQHIASQQISLIPTLLATHGGSDESTLYIEQRGYPSPYVLNAGSCPRLPACRVVVEEVDTLDCALRLLKGGGSKIGVLNMASAFLRGGGWLEGTTAQEEQICYRSTLAITLKGEYYPLPDVYPAEPGYEATDEVGCVYSPDVVINRRGEAGGYQELPEEEIGVVAVISVAGVDLRGWEGWNREVEEIKRDKIRLLLRVAARRGVRRLVLGALGCGVFRCPPEEVAGVFRGVLQEREFKGWWDEVRFAVLGRENFGVFGRVLDGVEVGEDGENERGREGLYDTLNMWIVNS